MYVTIPSFRVPSASGNLSGQGSWPDLDRGLQSRRTKYSVMNTGSEVRSLMWTVNYGISQTNIVSASSFLIYVASLSGILLIYH